MANRRLRPFVAEQQYYTYAWFYNRECIYAGFGHGDRCRHVRYKLASLMNVSRETFTADAKLVVSVCSSKRSAMIVERHWIKLLQPKFCIAPGAGSWPGFLSVDARARISAKRTRNTTNGHATTAKGWNMEINCTNVNQAVAEGFDWLRQVGVEEISRNGLVIVAPEPVLTVYSRPTEHVLFSPLRDANPTFHLMEALHMLAARNDIAFLTYFNKRFVDYSDDGSTQWGAYGYRWRRWFGYDQLRYIATELKRNPESRRAVLTMWDGAQDLDKAIGCVALGRAPGKDVPCNLSCIFDCRNGVLNMTVLCRSNDMLFGGYGANAVHFPILMEYVAAWLQIPVGVFRQFSNNYHVYPGIVGKDCEPREQLRRLAVDASTHDYYQQGAVDPFPLVNTDIRTWDRDLFNFMERPLRSVKDYEDTFFRDVAVPMYAAWHERRGSGLNGADQVAKIKATDWHRACSEWIARRTAKVEARAGA